MKKNNKKPLKLDTTTLKPLGHAKLDGVGGAATTGSVQLECYVSAIINCWWW
ncbi:MAG TPA: hypothetical protein VL463_09520 [Kofleriaceae bacterium]|jgi:hypothetical protein|nr:hypothetical protein [Kofleriaceae bacterium]